MDMFNSWVQFIYQTLQFRLDTHTFCPL